MWVATITSFAVTNPPSVVTVHGSPSSTSSARVPSKRWLPPPGISSASVRRYLRTWNCAYSLSRRSRTRQP